MLLDISSGWPDLQTMLSTLAGQTVALKHFVIAVSYMIGFTFTFRAIYQLKEYGELRTMMSSQTNLIKPLLYLFIGSALIYFPNLYHVGLETFFGQPTASPLAYASSNYMTWAGSIGVVEQIIQLVGYIAFVRGWILMSSLGGHAAPHGSFGKALWHIIGGILAINIVGTTSVIQSSLGFRIT